MSEEEKDPKKGSSVAGAVVGGAGVVVDIIGLIMGNNANNRAAKEAKAIDARNWAYGQQQDRFNNKIASGQLKNQKEALGIEKNRFAIDAVQAGAKMKQNEIDKLEALVNKNQALKDRVLQRWGM